MKKTRRQLVEEFSKKIYSGELDFSSIRSSLESQGYDDEDIKIIQERVDRDVERLVIIEKEKSQGKQMLLAGLGIMIVGILVTIATYLGIIDLGDSFIIAYGPALGGLGLAVLGAVKMNR